MAKLTISDAARACRVARSTLQPLTGCPEHERSRALRIYVRFLEHYDRTTAQYHHTSGEIYACINQSCVVFAALRTLLQRPYHGEAVQS